MTTAQTDRPAAPAFEIRAGSTGPVTLEFDSRAQTIEALESAIRSGFLSPGQPLSMIQGGMHKTAWTAESLLERLRESAAAEAVGPATIRPNALAEHAAMCRDRWAGVPDVQSAILRFPAETEPGAQPNIEGADAIAATMGPETRLGTIIHASAIRNSRGAGMVFVRVAGSNGARYWGRAAWSGWGGAAECELRRYR